MTQQILMILPSTEDEAPRLVGPFLTEATANAWADSKEIDPIRRVIRPLESPSSIYGYGRHALIPSPTPRRMVDMLPGEGALRGRDAAKITPTGVAGALAAWEAKKAEARKKPKRRIGPRGGISGVLDDVYGPPPPLPDDPTRRIAEDEGVIYQRDAGGQWQAVRKVNPTLRVEAEREEVPSGVPPLTGGIRHWITGEALALAPWNVMGKAEAVADWSGPIARFNHPTADGRVLELNGAGSGDWISHFTRVPVGVWVMVPNVGALPIGLCERVRVEDGWLLGEGQVSLSHFQEAAPELFASATSPALDAFAEHDYIPAAIDVTNGLHGGTPGALTISGPWELERVVFGSVPAWPGCRVLLGDRHLGLKS